MTRPLMSSRPDRAPAAAAARRGAPPWALAALMAAVLGLPACMSVGPDYRRPDLAVPADFKSAQPPDPATTAEEGEGARAGWKRAAVGDWQADRWWSVYADPVLDELVGRVTVSNQNVLAAEAAYRIALGALGVARAAQLPSLSMTAGQTRGRNATVQTTGDTTATNPPIVQTDRLSLTANWEVDLWGRIRRNVEANRASADASAEDLRAAVLSNQLSLVQSYFLLRVADAQLAVQREAVQAYERSLGITRNRYEAGVVARTDVTQAQTQLLSARAQVIESTVTRGQLEHAIAALTGRAPADLGLAPTGSLAAMPIVPLSLPSELLERRPDIRAAERRVVAANAQIGVATAAWFPTLSLAATGGTAAGAWRNLLTLQNRFWSIGPTLALTLFDYGNRAAVRDQAIARHDQAVANYRQTVLTAFQEVEDNLLGLEALQREQAIQHEAVGSATLNLELTNNQYLAGTVSYLNVVTAQTASYSARTAELGLLGRRLQASAILLRNLGGGWTPDGPGVADGHGAGAAAAPTGTAPTTAATTPAVSRADLAPDGR